MSRGHVAYREQAHVFPARAQQCQCVAVVTRRDDDLEKFFAADNRFSGGAIDRSVERDDSAKRGHRVACVGARECVLQRTIYCAAAGIRVFDHRDARTVRRDLAQILHQLKRRRSIKQVVVRERFAVEQPCRNNVGSAIGGIAIHRRRLVWILAVAQFAFIDSAQFKHRRKAIARALRHPRGDGGVVGRSAREGCTRERATQLHRGLPLIVREFTGHAVVLRWIGHHRDELEILRRRTQHRRSADVDLFDGLVLMHAFATHGHLEGIEIHAHQIDGRYAVLEHALDVIRHIAPT